MSELREAWRSLQTLPVARLLRELRFRIVQAAGEAWPDLGEVLAEHPLPILRTLELEAPEHDVVLGASLARSLVKVEELAVDAVASRVESPAAFGVPQLRALVLDFPSLDVDAGSGERTASAPTLPMLERLVMTMRDPVSARSLGSRMPPLLDRLLRARVARLKPLGIRVPSWGDDVVTMLVAAQPALPVSSRSIWRARGSPTPAHVWSEHANLFEPVRLDLRFNTLGERTCARLGARFATVTVEDQGVTPPWREAPWNCA